MSDRTFTATKEERKAIERIREAFTRLNRADRLALLDEITKGYCTLCGDEVAGQRSRADKSCRPGCGRTAP